MFSFFTSSSTTPVTNNNPIATTAHMIASSSSSSSCSTVRMSSIASPSAVGAAAPVRIVNAAPTGELIIAATPQANLVYTNHIYISDDASNARLLTKRPGQSDTYVQVNGSFVFVVRPHKLVNPGEVGLSSIQRETCRVSLGQSTSVIPWLAPANGSAELVTLRLDVELLGTKKVSTSAAELAPVIVRNFTGQVFTRGQVFCCDFNGAAFKFTVMWGEAGVPLAEQDKKIAKAQEGKDNDSDEDDDGVVTKEVTQGVVHAQTSVELNALPSKFFTFKGSEKKAGMLNPKFRFTDMGIGGLDAEFGMIFRRSFASRLFPVEITKKLGIKHVKGMLLYGPPVS